MSVEERMGVKVEGGVKGKERERKGGGGGGGWRGSWVVW